MPCSTLVEHNLRHSQYGLCILMIQTYLGQNLILVSWLFVQMAKFKSPLYAIAISETYEAFASVCNTMQNNVDHL